MAVFSDVDIRAALGNTISIEGFDENLLGPDSYDIGEGDIWKVTDPSARADIIHLHQLLGARGLNVEPGYTLPRLKARQRQLHRNNVLNPRDIYVAEFDTTITTPNGPKARAMPKSSRARDGIHSFAPDATEGFLAIVPYTFAEIPKGPIAQIVFYEEPTPPVSAAEMLRLYEEGKLLFSSPKFVEDEKGDGHVPLRFDKQLRTYIGGPLTEVDSSSKFSRSGKNSMFNFYLGITAEEFGTGDSHILWMLSREGHIYPNAPLVHANVQPQHHTLEVSLTREQADRIVNNGKPQYACSVRAYPLKTPTTTNYKGRFNSQTRPVPNFPLRSKISS